MARIVQLSNVDGDDYPSPGPYAAVRYAIQLLFGHYFEQPCSVGALSHQERSAIVDGFNVRPVAAWALLDTSSGWVSQRTDGLGE